MGLNASLMATVSSIISWTVVNENMGLLNVLFVPNFNNNETQFKINLNLTDLIAFFYAAIKPESVSFPVLETLPNGISGSKAVEIAQENPNRESLILWISLLILLVIQVFIIFILVINCCSCFGTKDPDRALSRFQMFVHDSEFKHKDTTFRTVYLILMIFVLIVLAVSFILLCLYFSTAYTVILYLQISENSTNCNSLQGQLKSTKVILYEFVNDGIESGKKLVNTSLMKFQGLFKISMDEFINEAAKTILVDLNLTSTINDGRTVFSIVQKSKSSFGNFKKEFKTFKRRFDSYATRFSQICNDYLILLNEISPCNEDCLNLKNEVVSIRRLISSNNFYIKSMKRYDSALKSTEIKFENIFNAFNRGLKIYEDKKVYIQQMVQTSLNIPSYQTIAYEPLLVLENKLNEQIDALEYTLEPVGNCISEYTRPVSISFYCIGGILIVMLIIASLIIARLLYRAFRDQLFVGSGDLYVESEINKWDKLACGKEFTFCLSIYFMIIVAIFATAIGLLLFVLTVVAGEGCIYFTRETAIQKTDYVFNSILAEKWREILPQWKSYFNMNPPRNALEALTTTCKYDPRRETLGLLYALGYENIVDINGIVKSKFLQSELKKGKSAFLREIDNQYIPTPPSPQMSLNILKTYLGSRISSISLENITSALENCSLKIVKLEMLYKKLWNFSLSHPNFAETNSNFSLLLSDLNIERDLANKLQTNIANLQDRTAFNSSLFVFINSIQEAIITLTSKPILRKEFTNQYDKLEDFIMNFIKTEGNNTLRGITKQLMPCFKAHEAYSSAVGAVCGEFGIVHRLIGCIYILALNFLFIIFLYFTIFNLAFFQFVLIRIGNENEKNLFQIV